MKILLLMALCVLLSSCNTSDSGSGIVLSATSLSLGDPNKLRDNQAIGYYPQKIKKTFSWRDLLIAPVYAVTAPLVSNLFRGLYFDKPNEGGFSSSTATQFVNEHQTTLQAFESNDANGVNYNSLLQFGRSELQNVNAGHVFYGLWQDLWIKALDIKRKVYTAPVSENKDNTDNRKSWTYSDNIPNGTANSFIGWKTESNRMIVRSVFVQIDDNGSTHKEAISATINADSIDIISYKQGTDNFGGYTVFRDFKLARSFD